MRWSLQPGVIWMCDTGRIRKSVSEDQQLDKSVLTGQSEHASEDWLGHAGLRQRKLCHPTKGEFLPWHFRSGVRRSQTAPPTDKGHAYHVTSKVPRCITLWTTKNECVWFALYSLGDRQPVVLIQSRGVTWSYFRIPVPSYLSNRRVHNWLQSSVVARTQTRECQSNREWTRLVTNISSAADGSLGNLIRRLRNGRAAAFWARWSWIHNMVSPSQHCLWGVSNSKPASKQASVLHWNDMKKLKNEKRWKMNEQYEMVLIQSACKSKTNWWILILRHCTQSKKQKVAVMK